MGSIPIARSSMTKNGIYLSIVAAVLAVVYVIFFTNWFRTEHMLILWRITPGRPSTIPRPPNEKPVYPVSFSLDRDYRLTSVKVFVEADLKTNKSPTPVWHLVSDETSVPTHSFLYGLPIRGMKPAKLRARAQALSADYKYVLLVEAGKMKGQTNFWTQQARAVAAR